MAKAKRTRAKRAKKKARVRSMRTNKPAPIRKVMVQPAEKALRDYIALLKDPCNGPLIGPVGATANGYITRFEITKVFNPTQANWYFRWTPGALSSTAGNSSGLSGYESATISGALIGTANDGAAPGFTYLANTAQTYRCLAACAQVRYTDTEVNRRGVVGSTICVGSRNPATIEEAFNISVDRARVPDQALEVLWQPADGDENFTPVAGTALDTETSARKNSILLSGTSCLAGSVSIRLVVVYQWTPGNNDSIILPVPRPGTGVTMARVVQLAQQAGFIAGHLIKGYSTGGLYGAAREMASMIKPNLRSMR